MEFETVNYLDQPLTAAALTKLLRSAGLKPIDVMRTKEAAYKEFVADKKLNHDQLIRLMAAHPELIQRPLVVRGNRVVLARPVERLDELGI